MGDSAYGSADMLGWLVHEYGIEPHVTVFDKSARKDGRAQQHGIGVTVNRDTLMQLPSRISIGSEKLMDAISGVIKAAYRNGQKSCPQPSEMLSLDTSGDSIKEPENGVQPSTRRSSKAQQKWASNNNTE